MTAEPRSGTSDISQLVLENAGFYDLYDRVAVRPPETSDVAAHGLMLPVPAPAPAEPVYRVASRSGPLGLLFTLLRLPFLLIFEGCRFLMRTPGSFRLWLAGSAAKSAKKRHPRRRSKTLEEETQDVYDDAASQCKFVMRFAAALSLALGVFTIVSLGAALVFLLVTSESTILVAVTSTLSAGGLLTGALLRPWEHWQSAIRTSTQLQISFIAYRQTVRSCSGVPECIQTAVRNFIENVGIGQSEKAG